MQAGSPVPEVAAVALAIRLYLDEHPRAADTAAGIQRWWLLPSFGELSLATVEAALAQLEEEGVVCRVDGASGGPAWAGSMAGMAARPAR